MKKVKIRYILLVIFLVIIAIIFGLKNRKAIQKTSMQVETQVQNSSNNIEDNIIVASGLIRDKKDSTTTNNNTNYLQELVDDVSDSGGGTIQIPYGTYYFTSQKAYVEESSGQTKAFYVIWCRSNVTIEGAGTDENNPYNLTVLKPYGFNLDYSLNMFHYTNGSAATYIDNADFRNFVIDADETTKKAEAVYMAHGKGFMISLYKNCDWDNVVVKNTDGTGFGMDCPINSTIKNCVAIGCGKAAKANDIIGAVYPDDDSGASGFGIGIGYSTEESLTITDCISIGNRKFGFFFEHQGRFGADWSAREAEQGYLVENCIAKGNKYDFGGERANDVTFKNCISSEIEATDENPLGHASYAGSAFYFGTNSRRTYIQGCQANYTFTDVRDASKEYYKPVYWALNNSILEGGTGKTTFNPDNNLSRLYAVELLWRMSGRSGDVVLYGESVVSKYDDVADNSLYADAVKWAEDEDVGILRSDIFRPNDNCTRGEFIAMLWRYNEWKYDKSLVVDTTNNFSDLSGEDVWYLDAVNWAVSEGILDDSNGGEFSGDTSINWGDAITWMYNSEPDYQVTYNYSENGGNFVSKETDTKRNGESIDLDVTATKSGYEFVGWNTNKNATEGLSSLTMSSNNVTLYAIYKKTITATFNYNGGSTPISQTIYNKETSSTVTTPAIASIVEDGYTYIGGGWSESPDANETIDVNVEENIEVSSNTQYYAIYLYKVTATYYYYNGSSYTSSETTATAYMNYQGTKVGAEPTTPSVSNPSGWTARGWSTDTSPNATTITPGIITTNTTYYYSWSKTATIRYETNGAIEEPFTIDVGQIYKDYNNSVTTIDYTIQNNELTRDGYNFKGWNTKQDGTGDNYENGQVIHMTGDVILYAQWKKIDTTDNTPPKVTVEYSTQSLTKESVTVTIKADEKLQELEGWTLSSDKKELSKEYSENTTETVIVKDLAGNEVEVDIEINNIEEETIILGDVNIDKKVDITDLLLLKRHIISGNRQEWKLTGDNLLAADINKDNIVDITDLFILKRFFKSM